MRGKTSCIYPNLEAELACRGSTRKAVAEKFEVTKAAVSLWLCGRHTIPMVRALALYRWLAPKMPFEVLFQKKEDQRECG